MSPRAADGGGTEIVIDALSARVGGGVTDLVNLLPALVAQYPQFRFSIVLSRRYQHELMADVPREVAIEEVDLPPMPSLKRLQFLRSRFPQIVNQRRAKGVLCMGELIPPRLGCPLVALVRNPNFFATWGSFGPLGKELRGSLSRASSRPFIRRLVSQADHLIFVSEAFRSDACRLYPAIAKKSSVAHLGFDPDFSTLPEDELHSPPSGRYILSVSGVAPHKNHETLLRAFARLVEEHDCRDLSLVIAGTLLLEGVHRKLVSLSRDLGIEPRVTFTDRLPHSSLPALYRDSLLHVLPSTFETFGHPYVEAMACGTPMVASDIAVAREICRDAAEYFPATDPARLKALMHDLINDKKRRSEMISRGRVRVRDFSWHSTASAVGQQLVTFACQPS